MIQIRIDRAQDMLRSTTQTVTQIAEALGYPDIFHFSKQFQAAHRPHADGVPHVER
jgi:transcriptional regulator GlxA family with amidase domain